MKRKNFLTSFCLSALFLLLGNAGWAQEPAYQTGFEASEGFTASTTYNNNDIVYFGNSGEQWGTYYGTASTTSPITGGQSMQMRWYSANADRIGYTFTNFDIANATKVVFKAKNTNGINVICSFSSDGGATYMGEETFTLDGNPGEYTYNISATGAYANVRVKFQITYTTAPTATSRLIIDDVRIYAAAGPDETAPTFASGYPTTANVLFTSLDALVKTDEPCTVYYKVVADGATAPTVDEVIDNNETITVAAANTEYSSSITGLTAETAYDIYFVAKDAAENTQATATKVDVTTLTADTKILTLTAPIGGESYNTGENATITWTSYNCESENIKIELYLPQDGNWSELVSSTTNDGSETITIPSDATYATNYKLRISLVSDATINSTSEDFTVLSVISIYNIQYTTAADGASPLVDQIVTTTGIVTAVNWNSQYNNGDFIIQDGTGLYSAIYAFRCATQVAIGDLVMVTGPVVEYNGLTEIGTNGNVAVATILSSGNTVPAPIEVTTLAANGEGYESMLVKVSNATYDGTALNDGSGSLNFYNKFGISSTPVAGNSYNVTGVILCHTSGPQIAPRTNDDVESLGGGGGGDETITPIYDIQYTTAADGASPLVNQTVTTTGIVTAVNWNDNYNNGDFTIQDGTGLYSAIYAFRCATQVAIGDLVMVTGPVVEYNGLTEIGTSGNVAVATILSSGNTVPEPIEVSTLDANGEGYESMLVKVSNATYDGTALNDGSGSLNFYNKFGISSTPVVGNSYNVTGVILCHTSGPQIAPRTNDDVESLGGGGGGDETITPIYDIQYTTAADGASPLVNQTVTTTGIVTAVNWNDNYNNGDFTIQDGTGLYSAIYAFRCATQVAIGDLVKVTGPVVEYNGLTEIGTSGNVAVATILSSGNTVPEPIEVSTLDANGEGYESMLVKVSNVVCDGTVLNDGSGSLNYYNKFGVDYTFEETIHYDIIGIILCHTSGPQICPRTTSDISITNDVEVNPFDTFSAYPNPFNNEIRFAGSDVKRVTIVSVVGSVLYDKTVADNELINTSDIPSGIYLVRFTNSLGQSTVKKMIKK